MGCSSNVMDDDILVNDFELQVALLRSVSDKYTK